jgi:hypothetical protein
VNTEYQYRRTLQAPARRTYIHVLI